MNLEYDDDESDLLRQLGDLLERIAPVPTTGRDLSPPAWAALVDAGLTVLGAAVSAQELPLAVMTDLSRRAGRQLWVEELVSSSFILSALSTNVVDGTARHALTERLKDRPGVLLTDGRVGLLPVVDEAISAGTTFGRAAASDLYRIIQSGGGFVLQRWDGLPPSVVPLADLSLSIATVTVDPTAVCWTGYRLDLDEATMAGVEREASLVHSAALVGCSERLLAITLDHVRQRVQFGVPIGSFQAVKHELADVYAALTVAWNSILVAVAVANPEEAIAPLAARVLAVDAALRAARAGAQFHGGMGYTAELNVHLFLKTILDGAQRGGSADHVAAELGRRFAALAC